MKDSSSHSMPIIHYKIFLGSGVKVLGGVIIRRGAVIKVNLVFKKGVPEYAIIADVTSQIIRKIK